MGFATARPLLLVTLLTATALLIPGSRMAAAQPFTTWYLAEGATGRGADFVEDILIANPGAQDARVRITFLTGGATSPPPYELTVKATSRATVRVNSLPQLADAEVSAIVESLDNVDLVVERTMAWPSTTRRGAHNSRGVTGPALRWFLAEGSTGFFNTFILIANPSATETARVRVTFLESGGGTVVYAPDPNNPGNTEIVLGPQKRYNVWPNAEVATLANEAFSTVVESTNNVGIIAERAMYWNTDAVFEGGHNSAGVTQAALTWQFAEGTTKSLPGLQFSTFLLLANPNASAALARVSFFTAPGVPPVQRDYPLPPNSRENVWVNVIPELANQDFSMKVESLAADAQHPAQPLVAERAVYWGPGTPPSPNWVDGHNTPGVTAEAGKWAFAEGLEDSFAETPGLNFDTYFLLSNSSVSNVTVQGTFMREDGTGIVRQFVVPAQSRYTIAGFQFPELTNQRFAAFFEAIGGGTFVAERAVYWGTGYFAGHASTGVPWSGTIATPPAAPAPALSGVGPAVGPTAGGTSITIAGTNFTSTTTSVSVGGVPASHVAVVNASTITAITGSLASTADQTVDVVVTNSGVTRTLTGAFTYVAPKLPAITSVTPASGPNTLPGTVVIAGSNFTPTATTVSFGSSAATVSSATPTSLSVVPPPRTISEGNTSVTVSVSVTTAGGDATAANAYTYRTFTVLDSTLAFGDSITSGVTDCVVDQTTFIRSCSNGDGGYPIRFDQEMEMRYPTQASAISVQNAGVPGEWTEDGDSRLPTALNAGHDAVVILEGINDLNNEVPINTIATNLREMVQAAKAAGKWVLLGTLTPVQTTAFNPSPSSVAALNAQISTVAQQEGAVLVDFFTALNGNASYFSPDGLHPSNAGYRRMAELLVDRVRETFEPVPPPK
ncbi:MAG: GDSL-type esterase/lipase family protein [Vicinamibacterales bacterium]